MTWGHWKNATVEELERYIKAWERKLADKKKEMEQIKKTLREMKRLFKSRRKP